MKKTLLTIIALVLMSSAMAQDSKPKGKNDAMGFGGGIQNQCYDDYLNVQRYKKFLE